MSLMTLPTEVLLIIISYFDIPKPFYPFHPCDALHGLSGLSRTCRTFHKLICPLLERILAAEAAHIVLWASSSNRPHVLSRALRYCPIIYDYLDPKNHNEITIYEFAQILVEEVLHGRTKVATVLLAHFVDPDLGWHDSPLKNAVDDIHIPLVTKYVHPQVEVLLANCMR